MPVRWVEPLAKRARESQNPPPQPIGNRVLAPTHSATTPPTHPNPTHSATTPIQLPGTTCGPHLRPVMANRKARQSQALQKRSGAVMPSGRFVSVLPELYIRPQVHDAAELQRMAMTLQMRSSKALPFWSEPLLATLVTVTHKSPDGKHR